MIHKNRGDEINLIKSMDVNFLAEWYLSMFENEEDMIYFAHVDFKTNKFYGAIK